MDRQTLVVRRLVTVSDPSKILKLVGTVHFIIAENATNIQIGRTRAGCYDAAGTAGIYNLIDQAAEVGLEAVSFGINMNSTWRSTIGVEFQSPENISWVSPQCPASCNGRHRSSLMMITQ